MLQIIQKIGKFFNNKIIIHCTEKILCYYKKLPKDWKRKIKFLYCKKLYFQRQLIPTFKGRAQKWN